jgi:CheY-like chemotaxis protein
MIVLGLASMPDTPQDTLVTRHTAAEVYGRPRSVLVAEDYPTNQQVVANHLKQAGLEYQIASDGEQAVEAFKNGRFDLVLMDIQMPRMDGYQATRLIREFEAQRPQESSEGSDGPPPRVPIVALTAHAMKGFRDQCLAAGMDDYATKPFRKSDLLAVLQRWLPDTLEHQPGAVPARPAVREEEVDQEDQPMDYARAVDEFEGDEDLVREVLDSFLETAQGQMREMADALEQGDHKIIARHAHSIKGGRPT